MSDKRTVFALSSGRGPSGLAVVRVSGPQSVAAVKEMVSPLPSPRSAALRKITHPVDGRVLDEALVLYFPEAESFTGEATVELQCHGGIATVEAVLKGLDATGLVTPAEPGDFSRQAFENGRMDLTELEGLSDLVAAKTEAQRKQALNQSSGHLRTMYEDWREQLLRSRALIEAEVDFADEDDVPDDASRLVWADIRSLKDQATRHIDEGRVGEIIRDGFRVALTGPPNAGKSSLINALAKREVAIVTPIAGTTRDVLEVELDLDGWLVIISDTAGIRDVTDPVEAEGVRRARLNAERADLVLWLQPSDAGSEEGFSEDAIKVWSKSDLSPPPDTSWTPLCTHDAHGLQPVRDMIKKRLDTLRSVADQPAMNRARHRDILTSFVSELELALEEEQPLELRSEHLRLAGDALGRLTGRIDTEDLLDVIFSEFCVGK